MIKQIHHILIGSLVALFVSTNLYFLTSTAVAAPLNKAMSAMLYAETAPCASPVTNPRGIDLGNPCKVFSDAATRSEFVGGTTWRTRAYGKNCVVITANSQWSSGNQLLLCRDNRVNKVCGSADNQCACDASNRDYTIRWYSSDPSCLANQATLNARLTNAVKFLSDCTQNITVGSPCKYLVDEISSTY